MEKSPHISGPTLFKPKLSEGQRYFEKVQCQIFGVVGVDGDEHQ